MKTKIFLLAVLIYPIVVMGQIFQKNVDEVKVTPPVFTGIQKIIDVSGNVSDDPLCTYLAENYRYPARAAKCLKEGTVVVQFKVTSSGKLTDFEVINSVCPDIDNEFIRLLKTTDGAWQPGYNNSTPATMEKEVSMMFVANQEFQDNPKDYFFAFTIKPKK